MAAEWWRCCPLDGICFTAFGEEGICEQSGAVTHSAGDRCGTLDCSEFQNEPVSCCVEVSGVLECQDITRKTCHLGGGSAEFPAGCGETISCVIDQPGACCVPDGFGGEECVDGLNRIECEAEFGRFQPGVNCQSVVCDPVIEQARCRGPLQDIPGYDGYSTGDKRHSLDLCETVVLADVLHRSIGGAPLSGNVKPGYTTPVTVHEVRAFPTGSQDPCRFYQGRSFVDHDGYVRPYMCSNPESGEQKDSRVNAGFGFVQRGNVEHGGRKAGYVYDAVGVEPPRWNEVIYRDNPVNCTGVL